MTTTAPRVHRLTWIYLGSIVLGLIASFALALLVFDGGTEATITGALMLGDALGWACIAVLSTRYTDHAQRWATVPTVGMAGIGLTLIAVHPGIGTMNLLGWLWPPALLVLVVWMIRAVRATSGTGGRWVLNLVAVFYVVCAVGATYQNVADHLDRTTHAATGKTYEINGHRLHIDCTGTGTPTVVLINGLGGSSVAWTRVSTAIAPTTRVCAYDRVGQGWSDSIGEQTPHQAIADMHDLLSAAGETGPFLLVGHSTGGAYAMTYAQEHLTDVAGVVLLDSATPEQFTALSAYPSQYSAMHRGLALVPTVARFGLARIASALTGSDLPEPAADTVTALSATARTASNMRDEIVTLPDLFQAARALQTLNGRPLEVVTASESATTVDGWERAQAKLAELSTNRLQRTVASTHAGLLEEAAGASYAVRAINDVIDAVRRRSQLNAPTTSTQNTTGR